LYRITALKSTSASEVNTPWCYTNMFIIIFSLPQPLYGCWYLLCQGSGYFLQPMNLNILPDVTLVQI